MTNPTSYTDEQAEQRAKWCRDMGYEVIAGLIESLRADRQRLQAQCEAEAIVSSSYFDQIAELQAEVEAWRHHANEWADAATNGPTYIDNVQQGLITSADAIAEMKHHFKLIRSEAPSATPTETKEAKS